MRSRTGHSPPSACGRSSAACPGAFEIRIHVGHDFRQRQPAFESAAWVRPVLAESGETRQFRLVDLGGHARMREPTPCLSSGPSRKASSTAPDHQLRSRRRDQAVGDERDQAGLEAGQLFLSPVSPLAASTVRESLASGTTWPSTKPAATAARRKGQGLSGETAIGWRAQLAVCWRCRLAWLTILKGTIPEMRQKKSLKGESMACRYFKMYLSSG